MNRRTLLTGITSAVCGGILTGVVAYPIGYRNGQDKGRMDGMEQMCRRLGGGDPTTSDELVERIDNTVELNPGEYEHFTLALANKTLVVYSVVADQDIDILMLTQEEFAKYRNDETPDYLLLLSDRDTSATVVRRVIPSGEYVLLIDNTNKGQATPAQNAGQIGAAVNLEAYEDTESSSEIC